MKEIGDITKLPKWAQESIRVLEMRLREERERNRIIDAGESDTILQGRGLSEPDIYLPTRSHIRFLLPDDTHITIYNEGDRLNVNASFGSLRVLPRASNSVALMVER